VTCDDGTAFGRHSWTPTELQKILYEERRGGPFLILRNGDGKLCIFPLDNRVHATIGRGLSRDLSLEWDPLASREHATLTRGEAGWSVFDEDSHNGTTYFKACNGGFPEGIRLAPRKRQRLANRDVLKVGNTKIQFRGPVGNGGGTGEGEPEPPKVVPTDAQMKVLRALCAPFCEDPADAVIPTNLQIAEALGIKEDTVKKHLRDLFGLYDIPDVNDKRRPLAKEAIKAGLDPCAS